MMEDYLYPFLICLLLYIPAVPYVDRERELESCHIHALWSPISLATQPYPSFKETLSDAKSAVPEWLG